MPLSAGFRLIWRYSERNADNNVGGADGMGRPVGAGRHGLAWGGFGCCDENPSVSEMESFRFDLGRAVVCGGGGVGGGTEMTDGAKGRSGKDGSGYCTTSSLNGPQKYNACKTEFA